MCFEVKAKISRDPVETEFILNIQTNSYFEKRSNARKKLISVIPNYKEPLKKR